MDENRFSLENFPLRMKFSPFLEEHAQCRSEDWTERCAVMCWLKMKLEKFYAIVRNLNFDVVLCKRGNFFHIKNLKFPFWHRSIIILFFYYILFCSVKIKIWNFLRLHSMAMQKVHDCSEKSLILHFCSCRRLFHRLSFIKSLSEYQITFKITYFFFFTA